MATFASLQNIKNELIRKASGGSFFLAPTTATTITTLTSTDSSLTALPTGWRDGGLMTDEGMGWNRATDLSEITSFGQSSPTRTDVSSDTETVTVNFQETNKLTIALFTGATLASLVPDATSGELSIAKPLTPPQRSWRALGLAQDSYNGQDIYIAKYFPNATVTDFSDQAFSKGDEAIAWGVTLRAQLDSTLGYAVKWYFGGPGFKALATAANFV